MVLGFTYALPNLYPTQPSIQVAYTDSGKSADQVLLNELEDILNTNDIQIIFPKGHLHFEKEGEKEKKRTSFYSVFVSYKMNLENKDLWV